MVTVINSTAREEEKRVLNEIASSHLAQKNSVSNLYEQVKAPISLDHSANTRMITILLHATERFTTKWKE